VLRVLCGGVWSACDASCGLVWALRCDSDAEGIGFRASVGEVVGCLLMFGCLGGKGDVLVGVGFGFDCSGDAIRVIGNGVLGCAGR
jgi:hypothetical protein